MKKITHQDLTDIYMTEVSPSEAMVKMAEECGELVQATMKFLALSYRMEDTTEEERSELFGRMVDEAIDVYITVNWLLGQLDRDQMIRAIGSTLAETLSSLGVTEKLKLEGGRIEVEHGFPIALLLRDTPLPVENGTIH